MASTQTTTPSTLPASLPASFPTSFPTLASSLPLWTRFKNERMGNFRPIGEFLDRNRLSKPNGVGEITQRLSYNLTYFQSNYILVVLGLLIYCLITNFWLLFTIIFLIVGLNFIRKLPPDQPYVFQQYVITQKQLYTWLFGISIPLLWISSAGSAIFWIIGASATLVLGHASLLEPGVDNGFVEEQGGEFVEMGMGVEVLGGG
ncbi:8427_t:CDS:2, partial [Ambispora gerdemannii]